MLRAESEEFVELAHQFVVPREVKQKLTPGRGL